MIILLLLKLAITMLIHSKDDIEFVTEFPCFWDTLYDIITTNIITNDMSNIRYKVKKNISYKRNNYTSYRKANVTKYITCSVAHIPLYLNTKIVQINQKIVQRVQLNYFYGHLNS